MRLRLRGLRTHATLGDMAGKLKIPGIRQQFHINLRNRFSCLAGESTEGNEQEIETQLTNIKESYKKTAEEVLGYRKEQSKP